MSTKQNVTSLSEISSQQWKSGLAAWLGWLFDGLDLQLYILVASAFVAELLGVGEKDPQVGYYSSWIQAAFLIGWALGGGFFGRIADRIGRSRALALTILTYALFTGLSYFAQTWWQLLLFRFLAALGIGGEWAVGASLVSETWPRRWRPWMAAVLQTGVNLGIMLASLTTLVLAPYPKRTVFLVGVVPALLVLWIRWAVPEPEEWQGAKRQSVHAAPGFLELFRGPVRRTTLLTLLVCAFSLTAHWAFNFWYIQHLRNLPELNGWTDQNKTRLITLAVWLVIGVSIAGNFLAALLARWLKYRISIAILCLAYCLSMTATYVTPLDHEHLWYGLVAIGLSQGVLLCSRCICRRCFRRCCARRAPGSASISAALPPVWVRCSSGCSPKSATTASRFCMQAPCSSRRRPSPCCCRSRRMNNPPCRPRKERTIMLSNKASSPTGNCRDFGYEANDCWAQPPAGWGWVEVAGVATDKQDRVYVFSRGEHPVMVFDRDGKFLSSWGKGLFNRPHGIFIGPDDMLYCTDDCGHTVRKCTPDGQVLWTLGVNGQPSDTGATSMDFRTILRAGPPFHYPTNVALAPTGEVYVSDGYGNARVHKFTPDGRLLFSWGAPGNGPGQFHIPHGIAVDAQGIVYLADRENSRIQLFTPDGTYLSEWTDVARPCQVFIDGAGTVCVAELGYIAGMWPGTTAPGPDAPGGRVSIFTQQGQLQARWGGGRNPCAPGDFFAPHGIWVDSRGDIYVTEVVMSAGGNRGLVSRDCHALQKFVRTA